MRSFQQIPELRTHLNALREEQLVIGFVPTMGALHDGHIALIRRAVTECDRTVVSIFVNPIQFGPGEDFDRYPRDLAQDSRICQEEGVDALFVPAVGEMFPSADGDGPAESPTRVHVPALEDILEGAARPGHLSGVTTICAKLFNIVQPRRAYFGQKDYQQLIAIQRMVADLCMPITVVPVATVREPDGLALSSRNVYLSPEERPRAVALSAALKEGERLYAAGERNADTLREAVRDVLVRAGLSAIEYIEVADPRTMVRLNHIDDDAVLLAAVRIGALRLIDNVLLGITLNQHLRRL